MANRFALWLAILGLASLFLVGAADAAEKTATTTSREAAAPHEFIRLKPSEKAPVTCDAGHVGTLALDSQARICVCSPLRDAIGKSGSFGWMPVPVGQSCGF